MTQIPVRLSPIELNSAAMTGVWRRLQSMKAGYNKNVHAQKSDWATDIDGAAAELAVSKYLGRYWGFHAGNLHGDDVQGGIQVRSTSHSNGNLILRKRDSEHAKSVFILVISDAPFYRIVGALRGYDAMVDKYYRESDLRGGESWWVPQHDLKDLSSVMMVSQEAAE